MKPQCLRRRHQGGLRIALAIVALPVLLLTGSSRAQDIYAYPAKGQSQSQQDRMSFMGSQANRIRSQQGSGRNV